MLSNALFLRCVVIGDNGTGKTSLSNKLCALTGNAGGWMFGVATFFVELGVKEEKEEKEEKTTKTNDNSKKPLALRSSIRPDRTVFSSMPQLDKLSFASSGGPHRVFRMGVWDTNGSSDYDALRANDYNSIQQDGDGLDVIVIMFGLDDEKSLESARLKWFSEAKFNAPSSRLILVGNKVDLRDNPENESKLIPFSAGLALAAENECPYFECCAYDQTQFLDGIEELMAHILRHPDEGGVKKRKNENCAIS